MVTNPSTARNFYTGFNSPATAGQTATGLGSAQETASNIANSARQRYSSVNSPRIETGTTLSGRDDFGYVRGYEKPRGVILPCNSPTG